MVPAIRQFTGPGHHHGAGLADEGDRLEVVAAAQPLGVGGALADQRAGVLAGSGHLTRGHRHQQQHGAKAREPAGAREPPGLVRGRQHQPPGPQGPAAQASHGRAGAQHPAQAGGPALHQEGAGKGQQPAQHQQFPAGTGQGAQFLPLPFQGAGHGQQRHRRRQDVRGQLGAGNGIEAQGPGEGQQGGGQGPAVQRGLVHAGTGRTANEGPAAAQADPAGAQPWQQPRAQHAHEVELVQDRVLGALAVMHVAGEAGEMLVDEEEVGVARVGPVHQDEPGGGQQQKQQPAQRGTQGRQQGPPEPRLPPGEGERAQQGQPHQHRRRQSLGEHGQGQAGEGQEGPAPPVAALEARRHRLHAGHKGQHLEGRKQRVQGQDLPADEG